MAGHHFLTRNLRRVHKLVATLFAAIWGAGTLMSIAAIGHQGSSMQETAIGFLLLCLSFAMILVYVIIPFGLRV
jgi:hypothetical protein